MGNSPARNRYRLKLHKLNIATLPTSHTREKVRFEFCNRNHSIVFWKENFMTICWTTQRYNFFLKQQNNNLFFLFCSTINAISYIKSRKTIDCKIKRCLLKKYQSTPFWHYNSSSYAAIHSPRPPEECCSARPPKKSGFPT